MISELLKIIKICDMRLLSSKIKIKNVNNDLIRLIILYFFNN